MMTTAPPTDDRLVTLRGGFAVSEVVILWLLAAEDRGLRLSRLADGRLFAGPRAAIAPGDDAFIRDHRDVLLMLVDYIETVTVDAMADARPP